MLSTGNHADVTIVVEGKVFPCHKVRYIDATSAHVQAVHSGSLYESLQIIM